MYGWQERSEVPSPDILHRSRGRSATSESTKKSGVIQVLYKKRSDELRVVMNKVREEDMYKEVVTSGAIEEAVESERKKGLLESRECADEKRWT